ncbi:hypothetical protein JW948_00960 [bacterium]|nr:hypothetical protein [bacterium]
MKIKKEWIIIGLIGWALFFSSCYDIKTTTRIFPDGSCERTVVVEEDSSGVADIPFPVPVDSTWIITYDGQSDPKLYTAVKRFPSVKALNGEYAGVPDTALTVRISQQLKKRFRWFNTVYRYEETYYAQDPFKTKSIGDYFTREELNAYYINEDTLDMENRIYNEYWRDVILESFFQDVTTSLGKDDEPEKFIGLLKVHGDSIVHLIMEKNQSGDSLNMNIEYLLGIKLKQNEKHAVDKAVGMIGRKVGFLMESMDFKNEVSMPGLILDTNAKDIEGNLVRWKFDDDRFVLEDYLMWVESRVVNRWAMTVTGIVCILLVVALIAGSVIRLRIRKADPAD